MSVVFYTAFFSLGACRPAPPPQRELPDFALTATSAGGAPRPLTRADLRGRVWVADFVFTRCAGPCPLLTANMSALRKRLPAGTGLLSFTVDPDHDTPAVLAGYARQFDAGPQWLFVTGPKPALTALVRDGFLLPVVEDAKAAPGSRVTHSAKFVLLDAESRVRGWYDGDDYEALDRLVADARRL
ncbi:MAG: SCO family protein [Elusimicrobiota bacterium]|nr:SCO family protein [Elusimicrobiota bacterium]